MKVRAKLISENGEDGKMVGYYDHIRIREGQIFELVPRKRKDGTIISCEEQFSKEWMERMEVPPVEKKTNAQQPPVPEPKPETVASESPATDRPTGDSDVI